MDAAMPAHAKLARRRVAPKTDLQLLQDRIEKFQREKFPDQPAISKLKHLRKEVSEWIKALEDESEMADVFILALGAARQLGYDTARIIACAHRKMEIVEKRQWLKPDRDGICRHKEDK
jgi:hypothetical protein